MMFANISCSAPIVIDQKKTKNLEKQPDVNTKKRRLAFLRADLILLHSYVTAIMGRYLLSSTCIACLWSCMMCSRTSPSLYREKTVNDPFATIWKSNWSESSSIKLCAAKGWFANAFITCTTLPSTCITNLLESQYQDKIKMHQIVWLFYLC